MKKLTVRLRDDLYDELHKVAQQNELPINDMFRKGLLLLILYNRLVAEGGRLIVEDDKGQRELLLLEVDK